MEKITAPRAAALMWLEDVFSRISPEEYQEAIAPSEAIMEEIQQLIQEGAAGPVPDRRAAEKAVRAALFVYAYNCGVAAATGSNK